MGIGAQSAFVPDKGEGANQMKHAAAHMQRVHGMRRKFVP